MSSPPDHMAVTSGAPILPSEGRASRPVGFLDALAGNTGRVPLEVVPIGDCKRCRTRRATTRGGLCESCDDIERDIAQSWDERAEMEL